MTIPQEQRDSAQTLEDIEGMAEQVGVIEVGDQLIPLLDVRWADERQWCGRVHRFLAGEVPAAAVAELRADCDMCRARPHGGEYCALTSGPSDPTPCLFDEPQTSEGWRKARRWTLVTLEVDGRVERALTPVEWATEGAPGAVDL